MPREALRLLALTRLALTRSTAAGSESPIPRRCLSAFRRSRAFVIGAAAVGCEPVAEVCGVLQLPLAGLRLALHQSVQPLAELVLDARVLVVMYRVRLQLVGSR